MAASASSSCASSAAAVHEPHDGMLPGIPRRTVVTVTEFLVRVENVMSRLVTGGGGVPSQIIIVSLDVGLRVCRGVSEHLLRLRVESVLAGRKLLDQTPLQVPVAHRPESADLRHADGGKQNLLFGIVENNWFFFCVCVCTTSGRVYDKGANK